ncbi:unnamed protein product, partial [Amoebophrya sp. A25]
ETSTPKFRHWIDAKKEATEITERGIGVYRRKVKLPSKYFRSSRSAGPAAGGKLSVQLYFHGCWLRCKVFVLKSGKSDEAFSTQWHELG